jgi:nicotinamidase/pyrazinamidase
MKALLLIDLQNDFLENGALAVSNASATIPVAQKLMTHFDLIVATQDWHPENHESFASRHKDHNLFDIIDLHGLPQCLWPMHCVQGSFGAKFSTDLDLKQIDKIIQKGTVPSIDSYSGFADNGHRKETELHEYLQSKHVDTLYIMGLATDYCVKFTVFDALTKGYIVFLVVDGCRGVNQSINDSKDAIREMEQAGAILTVSADIQ